MIRVFKYGRKTERPGGLVGTEWEAVANPLGNVKAVAVHAAAAGLRHIVTSISATITAGGTPAPQLDVFLRDGASGVGAIRWVNQLQCPANDVRGIVNSGLRIPMSVNTAVTLEFSSAGGASTLECVSMSGFSAV